MPLEGKIAMKLMSKQINSKVDEVKGNLDQKINILQKKAEGFQNEVINQTEKFNKNLDNLSQQSKKIITPSTTALNSGTVVGGAALLVGASSINS